MLGLVRKRNGDYVLYSREKIVSAVKKALRETGEVKDIDGTSEKIGELVEKKLIERFDREIPGVEDIQDIVEETLMESGLVKTAKAYILYRQKRKEIREIKYLFGIKDDLKLTINGIKVLEARYLLRDENGRIIETPREMFWRVARYVALVEILYIDDVFDINRKQKEKDIFSVYSPKKVQLSPYELEMLKRAYAWLNREKCMKVSFDELLKILDEKWDYVEEYAKKFYEIMVNLEFLPNSPTLMNANTVLGQLSACFVIPVEDSIESIYDALKYTAIIHKSGGGTGFSFSKLRPQGDMVGSTKGVASGPVSFMQIFDVSTDVIKQGGKRRGANMGILRVDHPDIVQFINAKGFEGKFKNFNLSVAITDSFMEALENDENIKLINPRTREPVGEMPARQIWNLITSQAWKTGDPGVIFIDEINRHNPTPLLGEIEATNPCGEQPLLPYESCNLGSINLSRFVENGSINWEKLRKVVRIAVRFLDDVIDANKYSLPQIEYMTKQTRKIGLGVMGFAEMLIKLGIPYASNEALEIGEKVMEFIEKVSHEESSNIANAKGVFLAWENSIWFEKGIRMRNATTTTIAPTGSISIIAGTSSGIEPLFALVYVRQILENTEMLEVNQLFEEELKRRGLYSDSLMRDVARRGTIQDMNLPPDLKRLFLTAHDMDFRWHVLMQAVFQRHTDNAVSKTINMRNDATMEEVEKAYMLAYKLRCKGITIYRDRSKREQVLYKGAEEKEIEDLISKHIKYKKEEITQSKIFSDQ
ncbi:MAG: adenosylcobalamin-dependent ribonucleoside-diphosphate reductase [Thermoplasmata archaeon]|jgi:ribonucleoside-diphosphate reductase alpha chain|nr:adenosylcobalamin-dependent ribonucleoside-diphosphate reductase [Thermoplasmatales archaeon]